MLENIYNYIASACISRFISKPVQIDCKGKLKIQPAHKKQS